MAYTLGIDWGTFNSAAAVFDGERTRIIQSKEGMTEYGKAFPSFLQFDLEGNVIAYGKVAKRQLSIAPEQVLWGVKRLIGLPYDYLAAREGNKPSELERFSYRTEKGNDGGVLIRVGSKSFTPTDLCEIMLRKIRSDAESSLNLGVTIDDVQLAVPAYFDDTRTQEIVEAAKRVGFKTVKTVTEPTAACFAQGLKGDCSKYVLAISIGAGTFEVAAGILTKETSSGQMAFLAKGVAGDPALGGMDMDRKIMEYFVENRVKEDARREVVENKQLGSYLLEEAERAKIALSSRISTELGVDYNGRPILRGSLSRDELRAILNPDLQKCKGPIEVALEKAELNKTDIDALVLIGGPMHMSVVRDFLRTILSHDGQVLINERVDDEFNYISTNGFKVNPMESVAVGAAIGTGSSIVLEPTPYGYGTEVTKEQVNAVNGTAIVTVDFDPIIEADSWQTEGVRDYKLLSTASRGISQLEFKLVASYKVWNSKSGRSQFAYRELGRYLINLPRTSPQYRCTLRRDQDNRRVDLTIRHPEIGDEWVFHKVHVLTGVKSDLPRTYRQQRSTRQSPLLPDPQQQQQQEIFDRKTLNQNISSMEQIATNLILEVETLLSIRKIASDDEGIIKAQLEKMKGSLGDATGLERVTEDRFIRMANQALALVHDLEVTQPPLLSQAAGNEWRRRIPRTP
jgi:molecular chaperone DnaK (HSP70)